MGSSSGGTFGYETDLQLALLALLLLMLSLQDLLTLLPSMLALLLMLRPIIQQAQTSPFTFLPNIYISCWHIKNSLFHIKGWKKLFVACCCGAKGGSTGSGVTGYPIGSTPRKLVIYSDSTKRRYLRKSFATIPMLEPNYVLKNNTRGSWQKRYNKPKNYMLLKAQASSLKQYIISNCGIC